MSAQAPPPAGELVQLPRREEPPPTVDARVAVLTTMVGAMWLMLVDRGVLSREEVGRMLDGLEDGTLEQVGAAMAHNAAVVAPIGTACRQMVGSLRRALELE